MRKTYKISIKNIKRSKDATGKFRYHSGDKML